MDLRAELPAAEATRLLRGRAPDVWLMLSGRALRPTGRPAPGAVFLGGPDRLAALARVIRYATALRVYAHRSRPAAHHDPAPGKRCSLECG
jgi:hypothetical protein